MTRARPLRLTPARATLKTPRRRRRWERSLKKRSVTKRVRQRPTVRRVTSSSKAMCRFSLPFAAPRTIFARSTRRACVLRPRDQRIRVARSSVLNSTDGATRMSSSSLIKEVRGQETIRSLIYESDD